MSYHKKFYLDNAVREIEIEQLIHKDEDKVWVNAVNTQGETPLHIAAKNRNFQLFESLLPYYIDIQATDNQGNTVLHVLANGRASKHKNHEKERDTLFRNLVSKGLEIHKRNRHGRAPIHYAATYCHVEMLKTAKIVDGDFTLKTPAGETSLVLICQNMREMTCSSEENKIIDLLMTCRCDINSTDNAGYSALHFAVKNCSIKTVEKLLKNGADLNILSIEFKLSPLYFAIVERRNLALVKILLNFGASLESQGMEDLTSLQMSILRGSTDIVKYLIKKGAVLNRPEKVLQLTPLQLAIYQERHDLFKLLIDKGTDVNSTGKGGLTPLHLSAMLGFFKFTKILIDRGADVNCRSKDQFTPLHLATIKSDLGNHSKLTETDAFSYENYPILKLLKCPHPPIAKDYEAVIQLLLRRGADVNALTSNGWSSLHFAAKLGRHKANFVKTLLDYGANIDYQLPNSGFTALHFASENDFEDIAKVLIDTGADINAFTQLGHSPVHLAVEPCGNKVLKLLIKSGADINGTKTGSQVTPLNLVLEKKYDHAAKVLISAGVNVNRVTRNGHSPIHLALETTGTDVLELLIEHGADINYRHPYSRLMPLHMALQKTNKEQALILIKAGADVNALTSNGKSPLSLTLSRIQFNLSDEILTDVLESLVASGANVNYKDPVTRLNPLQVAFKMNRFDIMKILIDAGADANDLVPDGKSPLHWALKSFGSENVLRDVLKSMVHHGADVNYRLPQTQLTPLHEVLKLDRSDLAKTLIEEGADVNDLTPDGKNSMHLALESNCKRVLNLLVGSHVKLNCKRRRCLYTLMYIAAQSNDEHLIDNLDDLDKTPLLLAIDTQEEKKMRNQIFRLSALVDASNKKSCLPMYCEVNNYFKETSVNMHKKDTCVNMCKKDPHSPEAYNQFISYQVLSGDSYKFSGRQVIHSKYLSMLNAVNLPITTDRTTIGLERHRLFWDYDMQCSDEVKKLKRYWIRNGVTLYNVFHMRPGRRRLFMNNLDLSIIKNEFKIYYKLISAYYYENKLKEIMVGAFQSALCQLSNAHIPIVCVDEIFWNLSIVDIIATIEAVEIID